MKNAGMISAIFRLIGSIKGTIWFVALLALVFLLALWIPQKGIMDYKQYEAWKAASPIMVSVVDALQLNDIYTAPFVLVLWGLFFINLAVVTWRRLPQICRQTALPEPPDSGPDQVSGFPAHCSVSLPACSPAEALAAFTHFGYRVAGTPERFRAIKNRFSSASSFLFHASFFLILLGGLLSTISRFQGVVDLATGETFKGELERYAGPPKLPRVGRVPDNELTITNVEPRVSDFTPTGLQVVLSDGAGRRHTADINKPYVAGHTYFVVKDLGVAPLVVLRDTSGREVGGAFFKLNVLRGKEDGFKLGERTFRVRFFADYIENDGVPSTRSEEFKNPVFRIAENQNGVMTPEITLRPGAAAMLPAGRIEMPEMRFWVRFTVIRERGLAVVYAGFLLAVVALFVRLVMYRREIVGAVRQTDDGCVVDIAGRCDFYRALADEDFERLLQRIRNRLQQHAPDSIREPPV